MTPLIWLFWVLIISVILLIVALATIGALILAGVL